MAGWYDDLMDSLNAPGAYARGGMESLGSTLGLRSAPADWGHKADWGGVRGQPTSDPIGDDHVHSVRQAEGLRYQASRHFP
jgi:hypothetical protein